MVGSLHSAAAVRVLIAIFASIADAMAGNPMCKMDDYRTMAIAYVPQLSYLDYSEIDEKDAATASDHMVRCSPSKTFFVANHCGCADVTCPVYTTRIALRDRVPSLRPFHQGYDCLLP